MSTTTSSVMLSPNSRYEQTEGQFPNVSEDLKQLARAMSHVAQESINTLCENVQWPSPWLQLRAISCFTPLEQEPADESQNGQADFVPDSEEPFVTLNMSVQELQSRMQDITNLVHLKLLRRFASEQNRMPTHMVLRSDLAQSEDPGSALRTCNSIVACVERSDDS